MDRMFSIQRKRTGQCMIFGTSAGAKVVALFCALDQAEEFRAQRGLQADWVVRELLPGNVTEWIEGARQQGATHATANPPANRTAATITVAPLDTILFSLYLENDGFD